MLSTIARRLLPVKKKEYHIHVVQYERADMGVGNEEELHWALILLLPDKDRMKGLCFQAIDRHYRDGSVQWELFDKEDDLRNTRKCLGGVTIGRLGEADVQTLHALVKNMLPVSRYQGWNCRDWVMELIQVMTEKGWVPYIIPDQATIIAKMKEASVATQIAYKTAGGDPVLVPLVDQ
ncbi:hypothetical protein EIP91_011797 [Steccherinum ochraceum]|uniref:Uncharacterized protein n=1 Tax=Steccherinum ochraceum TaxID=92696 RepID=A0A4R0RLS0_9APHY|nr:hypothetical protein EIP91_011797 [Steccherinum ochraceum]